MSIIRIIIIDDRSIDPLEHLIVKDRNLFPLYNKTLDKAVQHLTPKQTRILDLYYDKGFTNKEIGGLSKISHIGTKRH